MERKLYRIKNRQSMLGGVSQGLAEYFGIDVTLIRVVFVLLFFTPVPAFIAYLILWVVLPTKYEYGFAGAADSSNFDINSQTSNDTIMSRNKQNNNLVGGAVLIILGVIFSFKTFFHVNLFHYLRDMWPLFLIGLGIWLIIRDREKKDDTNYPDFRNDDTSSNL